MVARKDAFLSVGRGALSAAVAALALTAIEPSVAQAGAMTPASRAYSARHAVTDFSARRRPPSRRSLRDRGLPAPPRRRRPRRNGAALIGKPSMPITAAAWSTTTMDRFTPNSAATARQCHAISAGARRPTPGGNTRFSRFDLLGSIVRPCPCEPKARLIDTGVLHPAAAARSRFRHPRCGPSGEPNINWTEVIFCEACARRFWRMMKCLSVKGMFSSVGRPIVIAAVAALALSVVAPTTASARPYHRGFHGGGGPRRPRRLPASSARVWRSPRGVTATNDSYDGCARPGARLWRPGPVYYGGPAYYGPGQGHEYYGGRRRRVDRAVHRRRQALGNRRRLVTIFQKVIGRLARQMNNL